MYIAVLNSYLKCVGLPPDAFFLCAHFQRDFLFLRTIGKHVYLWLTKPEIMNIAELRLECLRLAVANENGKNPIYQVKDAQHYLDWIMSPSVTLELQTPVPDINVDPEYNEHLGGDSGGSGEAFRKTTEAAQQHKEPTPQEVLAAHGWRLHNQHWKHAGIPAVIVYSSHSPISWVFSAPDHREHWNSESLSTFHQWLVSNLAALSNAKEATPEQSLVSPEWTKIGGDGHRILVPEGDYRVVEAGGYFYSQRRGNGGWIEAEDNGTHIHAALVGAQIACERHRAKAKGSEVAPNPIPTIPEKWAQPDQSAEIRQENAITFLKSILPCSEELTGEVNHDNDTVDFFWRGYKYRFDPSKDEISLVVKSGDAIDNNASILMTALVKLAAGKVES